MRLDPPEILADAERLAARNGSDPEFLRTISPIINAAQEAGRVKVVGAIYNMATGEVEVIDQD